jgi:hypothetical protein
MSKVGVVQSRGYPTHLTPAGGTYGTALQAAAAMGRDKYHFNITALLSAGYVEIVTLLLEKGADPNIQGGSCAIQRMSDSHYTCRR